MAGGGRLRCRRNGGVAGAKTAPLTCLPQSLLLLLLLLYISPSLSPEALQTSFLCPDKKGTNMKKWTKQNKENILQKKTLFRRQLLDCRKLVALVARFVVNYKENKKRSKFHEILLRNG